MHFKKKATIDFPIFPIWLPGHVANILSLFQENSVTRNFDYSRKGPEKVGHFLFKIYCSKLNYEK